MSATESKVTLTDILGGSRSSSVSVSVHSSKSEESIDERSKKGQFGWFTLGSSHLPLLYRNGNEEFCSVRMAEMSELGNYLKYLNKDIYTCINVRSYFVTQAEVNLLNQINFLHCDGQFGRDQFAKDLLVSVNDVKEFFAFLMACYTKLLGKHIEGVNRLGFVMINQDSVVPYTVSKGRKYVPLFYFEGEIEQLKLKCYKLEGWDLSYLKFCCKIQGIKNQLFEHESCSVIDLEDIKMYFPPDTTFEEYWPTKTVELTMLMTGKSQPLMGSWTKPKGQPIVTQQQQAMPTLTITSTKVPTGAQQFAPKMAYPTYQNQQQRRPQRTYTPSNGQTSQLYNYLGT